MDALNVDRVSKTFGKGSKLRRAVDDVSLSVADGEIFGLLGMNGAGKSTTVKLCTGLLVPDSGSITVFGHDITADGAAARSMLNVSPQETAVAPSLSVRENLELIAGIYGADAREARERAAAVMRRLKLTDRANDGAKKLSGGLMRRLSIGMALISSPRLIFLDEPTLGLDVLSRRELWRYIRETSEHCAVVLTTHYLEEAEALCRRIAVMSNGRIVATGSPEELKAKTGADNFEDAFLILAGEEENDNE